MKDAELLNRRLAVIYEIVTRLSDTGKTNIQKIVYFLQEAVGVPLLYPFRMHYYGPYSEGLDGDVSLLRAMGYIDVEPDPNGFGFHVRPVVEVGMDWPEELERFKPNVVQAIDYLGQLSTSDIELYATLHFVNKLGSDLPKSEVLSTVKSLKPKFPHETINAAYDKLERDGLISA